MENRVDVCIIGAGPYGLSLASHLAHAGVKTRIFGTPFGSWRFNMPEDMILKSAGFASSLSDPGRTLTLDKFCAERSIPYVEDLHPIRVQDFIAYGMEFQKRFVPHLEDRKVAHVTATGNGFTVTLEDGEQLTAARVVMATGTLSYAHIPPEVASLPKELVTHTSAHHSLERFRGKDLIVIGGGSSAVDTAASAYRAGARVELYAPRNVEFDVLPPVIASRLVETLVRPRTALGPGWISAVMAWTPWVFRYLPADLRVKIVKRKLGPAAGAFAREQVDGKVPIHEYMRIESATEQNGRLRLMMKNGSSGSHVVEADHLIAGTGFRVDMRRLAMLDTKIVDRLRTLNGSPELSANFESTVPGLYFCGLASATSFGPLLRFVAGAHFAASTISAHLISLSRRG